MEFKNAFKYIKTILSILLITCGILSCSSDKETEPVYHTPESLENYLHQINQTYPAITYVEPAGTSAEGRTIWAVSISDNPGEFEPEPKIRLTGAIHGDENATAEVLIRLIDYIINKYTSGDAYMESLVDSRYIVIIPMMNPDGVALDSRENANNVDLNRNFDLAWTADYGHGSSAFSEKESQAMRDYSRYMIFNSSLTFHTGAVIVNMPFDYASEHDGGDIPAESGLVDYLALEYSRSGRFLESPGLLDVPYVTDGTINGGDWYIANGTLQDWSYVKTGCIDMTVEISTSRPETKKELDELFELNRDSILAYIDASGTGVYGRITNATDDPITTASITIADGDITTSSDSYGYYHRILLPGDYTITFNATGYAEYIQEIQINDSSPVELNVNMNLK